MSRTGATARGATPGQTPLAAIKALCYLFAHGANSLGDGSTVSAGAVICSPIVVKRATSIDRICLYINSGTASALWRLGVYADTGDVYPGAKLLDAGTVDATSGGAKEITIGSPLAVPAGVFWLAGKPEVAFATPRGTSGPVWGVVPESNSNNSDCPSGYLYSWNQAGLPDTFTPFKGTGFGLINTAPRVGVRVTG